MPIGLMISRIGMTVIYLIYLFIVIKSIYLYIKHYDELKKRYWGKNKGKPEEAVVNGIIGIILFSMLLHITWTWTPDVWK